MKRALIAASLVIFLSTNLLGSQANALTVMGTPDCAKWAEARSEDDWAAVTLAFYLVGVLDGMVMGTTRDFWAEGGDITSEQAFFWMDRYCDNNPLKYMTDGAVELFVERFSQ